MVSSMMSQFTSAWLFPGQGSQAVGMGRDAYESSPAARAVFDEADATLGFSLSRLCFEGPAETLTQTENAQPALLTTSVALLAAALEQASDLPDPAFVAGHSLGEYSALVAAGALPFADALRLVRRRGELMAAASEGTMAAIIGLDLDALREVCDAPADARVVVIANENSPGQLVISGDARAVARAMTLAKERGAKRALPLNVSAAFHSPLMRDAAAGLAESIAAIDSFAAPRVPVISNVTTAPLTDADSIRRELVEQVTAPVRWIATIERLAVEGVGRCVEIGAGTVLTGLVKRIAPGLQLVNVNNAAAIDAWLALEQQAGA
jgi:[acyl-carrier-protein] S-malonyltransferase